MGEVCAVLFICGFVLIAFGVFKYRHPAIEWQLSLARRWFLNGGEPTETYYTMQRVEAVIHVVCGVVMILLGISFFLTDKKGFVVELDGLELQIPCAYADIEALGYYTDPEEDLDTVEISLGKSVPYTVKNAEGKEIKITLQNSEDENKDESKNEVIAVTVEAENGPQIRLPNGVTHGMSKSSVESKMGRPDISLVSSSGQYMERVGFNTYKIAIVYDDNIMNRTVRSIRVEDLSY